MRKRAVVTGGAGFLGSHLCARLLEEDYDVVCLDDLSTGGARNVAHLLERYSFSFRLVRADVSDFIHVVGSVDAVLHFASPASPEPASALGLPRPLQPRRGCQPSPGCT